MFDENRAVRELLRLASGNVLEAKDYERLAMAALGEMLALDADRAEAWKQKHSGWVAYFAYGEASGKLEEGVSLRPCWLRLQQDLYSGEREAFVGVQSALLYAKNTGLLKNPRWGGERKREIERLFARKGIDPYAPPGMSFDPNKPPQREAPPSAYVAPDVRLASVQALPIHEQLAIADVWIALADADREQINAVLGKLDDRGRIEALRKLGADRFHERMDNRDIPPVAGDWLRDFPPQLAEVVDKLPPRSRAILAGRHQAYERSGGLRLLHNEVNNAMVLRQGRVSGDDLLRMVTNHFCNGRDSVGAVLDYEMRLEQGKLGFPAFLQLCQRHAPVLAKREQEMAARHAREQLAELRAIQSGPAADAAMSESHARLRAQAWTKDPTVTAAVAKAGGTLQTLAGGTSYVVYDDYYIVVDRMPRGATPEAFLLEIASDLNKTVNDGTFNAVNVFKRRNTGAPTVGEIVDIDIGGPDNGSVMLVELAPNYFIYTCIDTAWGGEHPEYGSREFGFDRMHDGAIKLYTRAVSCPSSRVVGWAGAAPQQTGWARLLRGLERTITARGGSVVPGSFKNSKWSANK